MLGGVLHPVGASWGSDAGGLLSSVAAPALLSPNLHLRAAGAQLAAAAAREGLMLPGGEAAAALAAAVGLGPEWQAREEEEAAAAGVGAGGGGGVGTAEGGGGGEQQRRDRVAVLPLCELTCALLGSEEVGGLVGRAGE